MIFDVFEDLNKPELSLFLGNLQENCFVDFDFSSTSNFFDLSNFSVFFLEETGEIFYLGPILLKRINSLFNFTERLPRHDAMDKR